LAFPISSKIVFPAFGECKGRNVFYLCKTFIGKKMQLFVRRLFINTLKKAAPAFTPAQLKPMKRIFTKGKFSGLFAGKFAVAKFLENMPGVNGYIISVGFWLGDLAQVELRGNCMAAGFNLIPEYGHFYNNRQ